AGGRPTASSSGVLTARPRAVTHAVAFARGDRILRAFARRIGAGRHRRAEPRFAGLDARFARAGAGGVAADLIRADARGALASGRAGLPIRLEHMRAAGPAGAAHPAGADSPPSTHGGAAARSPGGGAACPTGRVSGATAP